MHRLLLVEDEKEIFTMVQVALGSYVDLDWAQSIAAAREKLSKSSYTLLILDVELPDGNGIEFCSEIHGHNEWTPVFFLTAHADLSEKVLGFAAGADDYITKPFEPLELRARVESKLKKLEKLRTKASILRWKELEIDKDRQEVRVFADSKMQTVDLTALEFRLLTYFAAKPGHVIPREDVLDSIWGKDIHIYPRSVDTHVSKLRKKLGPVSDIIESVHGSGYKFSPTVVGGASEPPA